ncbi:PiggyBac transposable element-derived protein 4 [Eumeta japonica]|uniref:PiggyBac transposable element-derived protein 4 n=1 Tax=Eumeta variegata TaxID=151549 RepID=A0A4C1XU50_EUMVA|nr:PiggyBac transposable element-derived protein 4 [Eumeta japonica]
MAYAWPIQNAERGDCDSPISYVEYITRRVPTSPRGDAREFNIMPTTPRGDSETFSFHGPVWLRQCSSSSNSEKCETEQELVDQAVEFQFELVPQSSDAFLTEGEKNAATSQASSVTTSSAANAILNSQLGEMPRGRSRGQIPCLHLSDTSAGGLSKITELIERFSNNLKVIFTANKQLSLDESMVLWRGRPYFRRYTKDKRRKYGIKLYLSTEPDGLVLWVHLFGGSTDVTGGKGHTEKIVMHLAKKFLDKGHFVYKDQFYNGYDLAVKLLENKTFCIGTLAKMSKLNPSAVSTKLKKVVDEKAIIERVKPKTLAEYNKYMSGVRQARPDVVILPSREEDPPMLQINICSCTANSSTERIFALQQIFSFGRTSNRKQKKKSATLRIHSSGIGRGPTSKTKLSTIEERIVAVPGAVAYAGISEESGFPDGLIPILLRHTLLQSIHFKLRGLDFKPTMLVSCGLRDINNCFYEYNNVRGQ